MADELVGTIIMYVNDEEVDCSSVTPTEQAGRKLVATMNSKGRSNKSAKTTASGAIQIEAFVPESGGIDWASISDATIIIESLSGGHRKTYSGVGIESVGEAYKVDGEAMQSLTGFYKDYIKE